MCFEWIVFMVICLFKKIVGLLFFTVMPGSVYSQDLIAKQAPIDVNIHKMKVKVVKVNDYLKGIDGLPKSDVIKFYLEGNGSVVVRPSGTEPKMKVYVSISAADEATAKAKESDIVSFMEQMLK